MWIALAVAVVIAIGGWSAFGLMAYKYGLWTEYGRRLNVKIDQWQGQKR